MDVNIQTFENIDDDISSILEQFINDGVDRDFFKDLNEDNN